MRRLGAAPPGGMRRRVCDPIADSGISSRNRGDIVKRVVMNALQYKQNSSGIGVMIRELFSRYTALTPRGSVVVLPQSGPELHTAGRTQQVRIPWTYQQNLRRMLFQTVTLGARYGKDSVLLTTDSKIPLVLPKSCVLVPLITDLAVFRMPEVYQLSRVLWWRLQYRYLCRRADLFLTISQFTKSELHQLLHIPEEKIHVLPCAASDRFAPVRNPAQLEAVRSKYGLPEQFVLFVGNNNRRKNLKRMMGAFDAVAEKLPHHLVIAGEQGWKFRPEEARKTLRNPQKVHFIGYVPDEDMPALYSLAGLFLFPSLYEGFGIPILEAQQCGVPVLASRGSAMDEVGGAGALYVDPYQEDAIGDGILRVLQNSDAAETLRQAGFENAKRFSWERSAQMLNQIIEEEVVP